MKKIAIGADHRGYNLKESLKKVFSEEYELIDVGTYSTDMVDYPDIAEAVVKQIKSGVTQRGVVICGSGVGACVAANKFKDIRAGMCNDSFSAHQGVEDDNMNVLCLGSGVVGESLAVEIINSFLHAEYKKLDRYQRRLDKIKKIEEGNRD
jgi:RpiB/LacA/LacB family sugar-phosphate isomerase